jgi:hypothetical protein
MIVHSFILLLVVVGLLLLLLMVGLSLSHDVWVESTPEGFLFVEGDPGEKGVPLPPERVRGVRCLDADLRDLEFERVQDKGRVVVKGRCSLLVAVIVGPEGVRFLKHVVGKLRNPSLPVGLDFEIVTLEDPLSRKPGQKITLRVLLRGRPLKGARVRVGHKVLGRTREGGITRVRVREVSPQVVSAVYGSGPRRMETFLSFEPEAVR